MTQDGKLTQYTYDKLNRLATLSSPAGTETYTYDLSGLMREQLNSNGTKTVTAYDAASRPKRITLSKGSVPLNLTEYRYDTNGNREEERINRPTGAQVTTYGYDAADRLKSTRRVEGANTVATEWTYDLADNRLTETVASTGEGAGTVSRVYRYDERNQLRGITDSALGATTLDYDPQGNLKQKARGSDTTTFEWSARDLLVSVSRNGTLLGRYGSDHAGLRVHKEATDPLQPGEAARVLRTQWDDQNAVQDRDASGTVVARYDFAGGQPVAMWSATDGAQVLHADALGSVVATTATDGTVKSETLYDAWGTPLLKTGSSANKFAYTGHQADAETGLYYFKARYYDPETGRFISVDPAEGQDAKPASYHKYLYAYANPLSYTDPAGTQAVSPLPFPFNLLALAVPTEESRKRNDELGLRIQGCFRDKWEAVFSENASAQPSPGPWVPTQYPDSVAGARTEMVSLIRDRNRAWAGEDRNEWDRALHVVQSRINLLEGKFGKAAFEGMDVRFPSPWTPNSGPQIGTTVEGKPGEPTEVRSLSGKPINQPDAQRSRVPGTTAHSPDRGDNVLGLPRVDPAATVILMSEGNSPSTNKGGTATKGIGTESANAARALSSKLSALEDAQATAAKVHTLPDGRIRYYEAERAARTAGPSRGSSYVTEWNPANGNVRSWNEVYDQAGNVNRVHPKMINGQTVDSLHYPPTARELGR